MSSASVQKFWLQFFELYKSKKCLWEVDSVEYLNKAKRKAAYAELINLAKKINPRADHSFIRSRINNMRTAYRKEVKKVLRARQKGKVFKPKLYYYDLLNSFLNQYNNSGSEIKKKYCDSSSEEEDPFASLQLYTDSDEKQNVEEVKLDGGENNENLQTEEEPKTFEELVKNVTNNGNCVVLEPDHDYINNTTISSVNQQPKRLTSVRKREKRPLRRITIRNIDKHDESEDSDSENDFARKKQRSVNDECSILGQRMATHFRNMNAQQRLLAEKIISDVCIYARMEQLTLRSGLAIDLSPEFNNFIQQRPSKQDYSDEVINDEEVELGSNAYIQTL